MVRLYHLLFAYIVTQLTGIAKIPSFVIQNAPLMAILVMKG